MNTELFEMINQVEQTLSQEKKKELDQVGEAADQFIIFHSEKGINDFVQSLVREDQIAFWGAWLRHFYKSIGKLKGEVA